MFPLLYDHFFTPDWPFVMLRVFRYPIFCTMAAGLTAFFICCLGTPFFTSFMSRKNFLEQTRTFSLLAIPAKRHVPSMGGLVIIMGILVNLLLWCRLSDPQVWLLAGVLLGLGGTGMADDLLKMKRGKGLSRNAKYLACFAFSAVVLWFILSPTVSPFQQAGHPDFKWTLYLPFIKTGWVLGLILIPLEILFLVFSANAVNLTDGMDGLASVPVILTASVLGVMAYILAKQEHVSFLLFFPHAVEAGTTYLTLPSDNLLVACVAIAGAVGGFLWHNAYPATIIMGDTGSLALGGLLGTLAVLMKQEALFLMAGGLFVMETLSAFIQDFIGLKIFGRRILYRAPFHDALLYQGTGESKVTVRLWLLSAIFAAVALTTLKLR